MKKLIFIALTALFLAGTAFASDKSSIYDKYDYDMLVTSIRSIQSPQVIEGYIVFTADSNARTVGIAFDYENYSIIHPYSLRKTYDYEGEQTGAWYFYVMKKPEKIESISYKLIIDGLWTTDPSNKETVYDWENGVELSYLKVPQTAEPVTEPVQDGFTKFICTAAPGQTVRLGGSFTNWDSWIYEMTEIAPGKYEICLPLPAGTYWYAYYVGLKCFADETNPDKSYSADGKVVSRLIVN